MVQSSKLNAALPWQPPQDAPFSMLAWVMAGRRDTAERPRMLNFAGWQPTHDGLAESMCMSWLKVTAPGLSPVCGSVRAVGRRGRSLARALPERASAARMGASFQVVMVVSLSGQEELAGGLVPGVAGERTGDAVHRGATVLQDEADLGGKAELQGGLGVGHEPAGRAVAHELAE